MNTFENSNFIDCTLEETSFSFFGNSKLSDSGDIEYFDCCGQRPIGNTINNTAKYNSRCQLFIVILSLIMKSKLRQTCQICRIVMK